MVSMCIGVDPLHLDAHGIMVRTRTYAECTAGQGDVDNGEERAEWAKAKEPEHA
jgi:hypothetical protein